MTYDIPFSQKCFTDDVLLTGFICILYEIILKQVLCTYSTVIKYINFILI